MFRRRNQKPIIPAELELFIIEQRGAMDLDAVQLVNSKAPLLAGQDLPNSLAVHLENEKDKKEFLITGAAVTVSLHDNLATVAGGNLTALAPAERRVIQHRSKALGGLILHGLKIDAFAQRHPTTEITRSDAICEYVSRLLVEEFGHKDTENLASLMTWTAKRLEIAARNDP